MFSVYLGGYNMFRHYMQNLFDIVPEIDFYKGYDYYLHNMENYSKALLATLKSVKSKLPILRNMTETEEYEGLRMITQTLRRMMHTIGGEKIADLSYRLEMALLNEDKDLNHKIFEYLITLEDLADRMEELIKKLPIQYTKTDPDKKDSYFNYNFAKTKEFIDFSNDFIEKKII